ncbi:fz domain protein [Ostertagia ostertagi]
MSRVSLLATLLLIISISSAYLSDSWMLSSERPTSPRCVPIPHNLTICYGMQYSANAGVPNLLEHDTINEAIHQSSDWKSLLQLNCHPDTQGCEGRMSVYGFPWPEMFVSCEKYPEDNDMCIKAMNVEKQGKLARPMHGQWFAPIVIPLCLFSNTNTDCYLKC